MEDFLISAFNIPGLQDVSSVIADWRAQHSWGHPKIPFTYPVAPKTLELYQD